MNATQKEQVKQVVDIVPDLQNRILTIRGERVILDSDLAEIYGVEVRMLNQQVKRNPDRFPEDFSFILSKAEWEAVVALRSQIVTLKRGQHRKYLPRVFTEHGALMAANVLNSKRAVEMSVYVVRAFIKMRSALSETRVLARKLASLEREVKSRLDSHDAAIVEVMQRILDLIDPPGTCRPATPTPAQDRLQRKTACRASIEPAASSSAYLPAPPRTPCGRHACRPYCLLHYPPATPAASAGWGGSGCAWGGQPRRPAACGGSRGSPGSCPRTRSRGCRPRRPGCGWRCGRGTSGRG